MSLSKNVYHSSSSVESTLPTFSPLCLQYTVLHYLSVCITAVSAGGERLGESSLRKTKGGGLSVLRVICILWVNYTRIGGVSSVQVSTSTVRDLFTNTSEEDLLHQSQEKIPMMVWEWQGPNHPTISCAKQETQVHPCSCRPVFSSSTIFIL